MHALILMVVYTDLVLAVIVLRAPISYKVLRVPELCSIHINYKVSSSINYYNDVLEYTCT